MKKWLCLLLCFQLFTLNFAYAQQQSEDDLIKNTQNDLMIVGAATVGGMILGLSTLSFYDKPSEHINNIWGGAALGVIAGVVFVAYSSAQKGQEDLTGQHSSEEFSTSERVVWHSKNTNVLTMQSVQFGTQIWNTTF